MLRNRLLATWRDDIKTASMSIPLTTVLLSTIKMIHDDLSRNPKSRTLHERFSSMRTTVQRKLRWTENNWCRRKPAQIQSYSNINDAKSFYEARRDVYGPNRFSLHPVKSTDCVQVKNKEFILAILAEYLQNLLINVHASDPGFLHDLPTLPIIPNVDDPPSFDEVKKAILNLKDNKTAGPVNITAEVINYGGCALHRRLYNFILDCWSAKCLTQQWKNANIILVNKQNGDRAECGNGRGIFIHSVAGKVLAKIMLKRLREHVVDLVMPES